MIRKLQDFSTSKQTWRGNRLKDITNRSSSRLNTVLGTSSAQNQRFVSEEREQLQVQDNTPQRQSITNTLIMDKSTLKNNIVKKQRDSSTESNIKSFNDLDEPHYRFKLQSKNKQEEKNPYVLKFLPQDANLKRQPLSLWKKNINHQKERKSLSRAASDQKNLSVSKENRSDQPPNIKHTFHALNGHAHDSEPFRQTLGSRNFQMNKTITENSMNLTKNGIPGQKDDTKKYFIKTLQTKFMKKFKQKKSMFGADEHSEHGSTTLSAKKSFTELVQCLVHNKEEKTIKSLTDLKAKPQKLVGSSLRGTMTHNTSIVRSLSQLDSHNQIASLSELPGSQKSIPNEEENKAAFTTFLTTSSLIKSFTIKKYKARPQS